MKIALDSNVLIYAFDDREPIRQERAITVIAGCTSVELILANQVVGEVIAVIGRKRPDLVDAVLAQLRHLTDLVQPVTTETAQLLTAASLSRRYRLQYWDALIWRVVADAGARWFLSEDLQDGLTIGDMTVINPFEEANAKRLAAILRPKP